jgi:hypothetical protein
VEAKIALLSYALISVKVDGTKGACIDACLTPRTSRMVDNDNSVVPLGDGLHRTCLGTGRIIAVATHGNVEGKIEAAVGAMRPLFSDHD